MDFGCLDLFYFLVNVWKGFLFYKCLCFRFEDLLKMYSLGIATNARMNSKCF
jgi:hypothetical protein